MDMNILAMLLMPWHSSPLLNIFVIIENVLSYDFVLAFFEHVLQVEYFSHSSYVLFGIVILGHETVRCTKLLFGIGRRFDFFWSFASWIVCLLGLCSGGLLLGTWAHLSICKTIAFDLLHLNFLLAVCLFENASDPDLIFGLCEAGIMLCQVLGHRTKRFLFSIPRHRFWILLRELIHLRPSSQTIQKVFILSQVIIMRFENLFDLRFAFLLDELLFQNGFMNYLPKHDMLFIGLIMQQHLLVKAQMRKAIYRPLSIFYVLF